MDKRLDNAIFILGLAVTGAILYGVYLVMF